MLLPLPFTLASFPSPSLSRSIWEYGRARASRQNPENWCYVFSGENNPGWFTNLSPRPVHYRDNGISVIAAPSPRGNPHVDYSWRLPREFVFFHKRAPYECQGYLCLDRIGWRQNAKNDILRKNGRYIYESGISNILKAYRTFIYYYDIWKISSSSIKYRCPSAAFDTINDAMSKWSWNLAIVPLYAFCNGRISGRVARKESFSRFSRIELLFSSWYKSRLSYDSVQTARNKATLATLVRLGDAKSDTRARITMLFEYIRIITGT